MSKIGDVAAPSPRALSSGAPTSPHPQAPVAVANGEGKKKRRSLKESEHIGSTRKGAARSSGIYLSRGSDHGTIGGRKGEGGTRHSRQLLSDRALDLFSSQPEVAVQPPNDGSVEEKKKGGEGQMRHRRHLSSDEALGLFSSEPKVAAQPSNGVSVEEVMLQRELAGLNEDLHKDKRWDPAHSNSAVSFRRSPEMGPDYHDSTLVGMDDNRYPGLGSVELDSAALVLPIISDEDVSSWSNPAEKEEERRRMWNKWYEEKRGERPSPNSNMGKEWIDVLLDSIAGFGQHAPQCVLGDVAEFLRQNCSRLLDGDVGARPGDLFTDEVVEAKGSLTPFSSSMKKKVSPDAPTADSPAFGARGVDDKPLTDLDMSISRPVRTTFYLPHSSRHESALLFIDISGFTKLSTMLEVEDLSKAINSYFDIIVTEVLSFGGDVLKFAGDALFAEWQVNTNDSGMGDSKGLSTKGGTFSGQQNSKGGGTTEDGYEMRKDKLRSTNRTLVDCVMAAAFCGASICKKCSGFKVYANARKSSSSRKVSQATGGRKKRSVAKLNIHCGVGAGSMVALHVGNVGVTADGIASSGETQIERRREFLFLGDPIDQVAKAEAVAQTGELAASPEVVQILSYTCDIPKEFFTSEQPSVIARRSDCLITPKIPWEPPESPYAVDKGDLDSTSITPNESLFKAHCEGFDCPTLELLRDQLSLYAHPVVRGDELAKAEGGNASQSAERHRADAELRSVYVMFILPLISAQISGDPQKDEELFIKLSEIMRVTTRVLYDFNGHLRQFIVDDKGIVLIGTFGLRGSTFPNMVPENALPATLAIHSSLKSELGVENKIGATFGKVYCGVVGGVHRHEYAVLGPSVNLAARLMASKENTGVLVDEAVQSHAKAKFNFRSHTHIKAKGYAALVPTFEPIDPINQKVSSTSM